MALDASLCSGDPGNCDSTLPGREEAPIARRIGKNDENDNADNDSEAAKKAKYPPETVLASGSTRDEDLVTYFQGGSGWGETVPRA
jgi:hypothetical protein